MDSLNRMAIELVDEALDFAEELNIGAHELSNDATVLDFGVEFDGGIEAGLLLTEIQTAGLATVRSRMEHLAGAPLPVVELTTDHPGLALLCAQKAGWEVSVDSYEALGSGPARALVAREPAFQAMEYVDAFDLTVLVLEATKLPTAAVTEHVAELADVDPSGVFLPTFPTGSLTGSVVLAARAPEAALFRLFELGYDPTNVRSISGTAPIAPVPADEATAIARTTDAITYGSAVHMVVEEDDEAFEALPSTAADRYGMPLESVFESTGWRFNDLEPDLFAPAQVTVDVVGGPTHVYGERSESVLAESFGL